MAAKKKSARTANPPSQTRIATRLPASVNASAIELHFELDPNERTFRGTARYTFQRKKRSRKLELHAADLKISDVHVRFRDQHLKGRIEWHPASERVVFHFDRLLPAEPIQLDLRFRGRVRDDLRGLYRSVDRQNPWLATQLCPTDARRLFPCLDEPAFKARYRIRVTVPKTETVISNSPIEFEQQADDGRKIVQFEETPLLSAYLIAIAVGPFVASPVRMSGSTPIRVYTLPGRERLAQFALETAGESLARLEKWFDMDHPYSKLDLIALPDFAFGAMENAGAVFFRDSVLLLDPQEASFEDRKRAAETIAHEISHMWFGNLVTMAWWNDLWLNESFATWMAYEILEGWQPSWKVWLDFAHRREDALEVDALASSHPIAPTIRTADEAHENFDAITYTKGASVLRMLEGYLGRSEFREGIRLYIRRHREGAASASDLWTALSETTGEPIEKIVSPWTRQTGYPLVSLHRSTKPDKSQLALSQERFLSLPAKKSKAQKPGLTRWQIPWVGRIGGVGHTAGESAGESAGKSAGKSAGRDGVTVNHLLGKMRDLVEVPSQPSAWVYGNAREAGFFRVVHGAAESRDLLQNLSSLSALERIGLIGNQWALARSGHVPISRLLDLLAGLGDEDDPDVLFAVESVLGRLGRRLVASRGPAIEERFRAWVAVQFGPQLDQIGLDVKPAEDIRQRIGRARLFSIVGGFAHVDVVRRFCLTQATRHFANNTTLPSETGGEILRIAANIGDQSLHDLLCDATRKAETPQMRRRNLFALAEFNQPGTITASLKASLDVGLAPAVDRATLIAAMLARPASAKKTWHHLQKIWPRLEKQMPPILLARLAGASAEALPLSSASEIKKFFRAHSLAAGSRVLRQISEDMAIAKRFEHLAGDEFEAYLAIR